LPIYFYKDVYSIVLILMAWKPEEAGLEQALVKRCQEWAMFGGGPIVAINFYIE
jgi:hypothetical protein|tara:strand:+ start:9664 stop:9825 length:162 start_codon:yes stop_codon:yes gene_type:complete